MYVFRYGVGQIYFRQEKYEMAAYHFESSLKVQKAFSNLTPIVLSHLWVWEPLMRRVRHVLEPNTLLRPRTPSHFNTHNAPLWEEILILRFLQFVFI